MQLIQGKQFAKTLLQKEPQLQRESLGIPVLLLLLQLFECLVAMLFLRLRQEDPVALFHSSAWQWRLLQLVCLTLPTGLVKTACFWHLWRHCSQAMEMLPAHAIYPKWKIFAIALQNAIIRTLLLQSVPLTLFGAYRLAKIGIAHTESAPWLFGSAQLVVLAVFFFLFWIYVCVALWSTPFLWLAQPNLSIWRIPFRAMRVMHGNRTALFSLLLWYKIQMLPIFTIPYILPQLVISITAFFHIQIRKYEEHAI